MSLFFFEKDKSLGWIWQFCPRFRYSSWSSVNVSAVRFIFYRYQEVERFSYDSSVFNFVIINTQGDMALCFHISGFGQGLSISLYTLIYFPFIYVFIWIYFEKKKQNNHNQSLFYKTQYQQVGLIFCLFYKILQVFVSPGSC